MPICTGWPVARISHLKFGFIVFLIGVFGVSAIAQTYKCLGADVKADDVVGFGGMTSRTGEKRSEKITVKQTLVKMKARCTRGKLVDRRGRQIRFYFLKGCWGNPPADHLEIMEQQRKDLADLRKRFTVIEMTCDPGGAPRQSISKFVAVEPFDGPWDIADLSTNFGYSRSWLN
jgi:hypothetical protein